MLDSIRLKSDTNYSKPYRNADFVTSEYFVNRKDSTVCQLMKDSSGEIRQILVAKNNRNLFAAQYYQNGQLVAFLPIGNYGKYNGQAILYFENGRIKSKGSYTEGFHTGKWYNYSQDGNVISVDEYDDHGELIRTSKK